jgi:hypothetical protein
VVLPQVGYSTLVYPHHNNDYLINEIFSKA